MKKKLCAGILCLLMIHPSASAAEPEPSGADAPSTNEANGAPGVVTLTPENLEHVEIKTEPARLGNLDKSLKVPGRVSLNLNRTAVVTSTLEGRLRKLNYDLNDEVRAGDVLALVESPELLGKPLALKSPVAGVITDRTRSVGELVNRETDIYTVSDPARLWVIAEIRERDLGLVRLGQDATFRVLSYPERKFAGRVSRIGSEVEQKSRTVEVRIDVEDDSRLLKPGMFADVEILTTVIANVPLISDAALQTDGREQIVFVALGGNRYEKRRVRLGHQQDGVVQILHGVGVGEEVVTDGSFILKSELLKGELGEE